MKIGVVLLKAVCTIVGAVGALLALWALRAMGAVEADRSIAALLVVASAVYVLLVLIIVWARRSPKVGGVLTAAGVLVAWLAYGIHPKTDNCPSCLFGI